MDNIITHNVSVLPETYVFFLLNRIERLWVDVWRCVSSLHYSLFRQLEDGGLLDTDNEHHIFALQYVYQPRIQQSLDR